MFSLKTFYSTESPKTIGILLSSLFNQRLLLLPTAFIHTNSRLLAATVNGANRKPQTYSEIECSQATEAQTVTRTVQNDNLSFKNQNFV